MPVNIPTNLLNLLRATGGNISFQHLRGINRGPQEVVRLQMVLPPGDPGANANVDDFDEFQREHQRRVNAGLAGLNR